MHRIRTLLSLCIVLVAPTLLRAQSDRFEFSPQELYPGRNVITFGAAAGIERISVVSTTGAVVVSGEGPGNCERQQDLVIEVATADLLVDVVFEIVDCRNRSTRVRLPINNVWRLDVVRYPIMTEGERRCMTFRIAPELSPGIITSEVLDSVSVSDPRATLRFFSDLPVRIHGGTEYRYQVCFTADEPGTFRIPVVTWMRRRQPSGGATNYPVADTALIIVREGPVSDPTTFRSVVVPNAVIPPARSFVFGSYDVFGVLGAYAVSDNIMLMAGGALPLPDDWAGVRSQMFGAASIGAKAGLAVDELFDVAIGYQYGVSMYDEERTPDATESVISVHAPWAAISYGNNDSRASLTLGYAMKHHSKPEIEFDENAVIAALGGDYRLARHWKVAGEIAFMETLGVVPIVATARYFTNTYAIDAGIGFAGITTGDAAAPRYPLLPVVSAVFVF